MDKEILPLIEDFLNFKNKFIMDNNLDNFTKLCISKNVTNQFLNQFYLNLTSKSNFNNINKFNCDFYMDINPDISSNNITMYYYKKKEIYFYDRNNKIHIKFLNSRYDIDFYCIITFYFSYLIDYKYYSHKYNIILIHLFDYLKLDYINEEKKQFIKYLFIKYKKKIN